MYLRDTQANDYHHTSHLGFPGGNKDKELACQCWRQETKVQSLGREDTLEDGKATHSSILAWRVTVHRVTKSQK